MAQKIETLTNYFKNGLVMDLSPTNTPDSCLSNALNATLITYNGNEFSLLNDMGNGRVETAFLPQGYIPVGTCSFGGIIYIVSYNPLENKSQIGCFPSPERNIESDELSDLTIELGGPEFVEIGADNTPTGVVKNFSVKKLLTVNNLNPGDKFVIHWNDDGKIAEPDTEPGDLGRNQDPSNYRVVSNFGNTRKTNELLTTDWPKLMRIHLISIEESGKINYLDSTVLWYDYFNQDKELGPFFLKTTPHARSGSGTPDIDDYRGDVGNAYSVFLSKVSGKLALLIDLERINTFGASYKITKSNHRRTTDTAYDYFDVYLSTSWDTDNPNVNPLGIILTSASISETEGQADFEWINPSSNLNPFPSASLEGFDRNKVLLYNYSIGSNIRNNPQDLSTYKAFRACEYYHHAQQYADVRSIKYDRDNLGLYNTELTFTEEFNDGQTASGQVIPADIVVNRFNDDILTFLGTVKIPRIETSTGYTYNGILSFTVAPCMKYGVLEDLAVPCTIDFSQYNYGIELTHWKYSVSPNALQLTWGFKTDLGSDLREITSVVMDFYDFLGHAATFTAANYESYNGQFTEYITLNMVGGNLGISYRTDDRYKIRYPHYAPAETIDLTRLEDYSVVYYYKDPLYVRYNDKLYLLSKPPRDSEFLGAMKVGSLRAPSRDSLAPEYLEHRPDGIRLLSGYDPKVYYLAYKEFPERFRIFKNDAGTLYYGRLYLVKIVVNYTEGGDKKTKTYYRWLWNNGIYNDKQHTNDFDVLPLPLKISAQASLDGKDLSELTTKYYGPRTGKEMSPGTNYLSLGALITSIGYHSYGEAKDSIYSNRYSNNIDYDPSKDSVQKAKEGNTGLIYLKLKPGFADQANFVFNTNKLDQLTIKVATDNPRVLLMRDNSEVTPDDLQHIYSDTDRPNKPFIKPVIIDSYNENNIPVLEQLKHGATSIETVGDENLYDGDEKYLKFADTFSLEILDKEEENGTEKTEVFSYIDDGDNAHHPLLHYALLNGKKASGANSVGFVLQLRGVSYSKTYSYESRLSSNTKILRSLLKNGDDWKSYNLAYTTNGKAYFKKSLYLWYEWNNSETADLTEITSCINLRTWTSPTSCNESSVVRRSTYEAGKQNDYTVANTGKVTITLTKILMSTVLDYGFVPLAVMNGVSSKTFPHSTWNSPTLFDTLSESNILCVNVAGDDYGSYVSTYNTADNMKIQTLLPLAEFVRNNVRIPQGFPLRVENYQTIAWKTSSPSNPKTQADMVASLLGLIYVWDNTLTSQVYKYVNAVTLEDYQEVWQKDIIAKIVINNESSDDYEEMTALEDITLGIISLKTAIDYTIMGLGYTNREVAGLCYQNVSPFTVNNYDPTSDNPMGDRELESTQCLKFQYNVSYNVDKILDDLEVESALVYDFTDGNKQKVARADSVSIEQNKGYFYDSANKELIGLSPTNDFYLLENYSNEQGSVSAEKSDYPLSLDPYSDFDEAFCFKFNNLRVNPTKLGRALKLRHDDDLYMIKKNKVVDYYIQTSLRMGADKDEGMHYRIFNYPV